MSEEEETPHWLDWDEISGEGRSETLHEETSDEERDERKKNLKVTDRT